MAEIRVRIKRGDRELELGGDQGEVSKQLTTLYPALFEEEIVSREAGPAKKPKQAVRRRKARAKGVKTPPDMVDRTMEVLERAKGCLKIGKSWQELDAELYEDLCR